LPLPLFESLPLLAFESLIALARWIAAVELAAESGEGAQFQRAGFGEQVRLARRFRWSRPLNRRHLGVLDYLYLPRAFLAPREMLGLPELYFVIALGKGDGRSDFDNHGVGR
jgi:hypothetical protein